VLEVIRAAAPPLVHEVRLFDVYRGQGLQIGKKSLAFLVVMHDTERTMTDEAVDAVMAGIIESLASRVAATLRA